MTTQPARDRLTEAQRAKVLELLALGLDKATIARRFGVSRPVILSIAKQAATDCKKV